MNLHLNPEAFAELVTAASNELHIPPEIIFDQMLPDFRPVF